MSWWVYEDQSAVHRWKPVVDNDVDPLAVLPDLEVKHSGVVLDEQVVIGNHVLKQVRVSRRAQWRGCSQEPTVTYHSHDFPLQPLSPPSGQTLLWYSYRTSVQQFWRAMLIATSVCASVCHAPLSYRNYWRIIVLYFSMCSPIILVFPVLNTFAKFRQGHLLWGRGIQVEYISFEISTNGKRYTVLTFCSQLTRDVLAIANVLVGTLYGMALLDRPKAELDLSCSSVYF